MPVALLHAEPGLQTVKHSPFARRTALTVPAMAVLIAALLTAPAAAPAHPVIVTNASSRNLMKEGLLPGDMFFEPAAF